MKTNIFLTLGFSYNLQVTCHNYLIIPKIPDHFCHKYSRVRKWSDNWRQSASGKRQSVVICTKTQFHERLRYSNIVDWEASLKLPKLGDGFWTLHTNRHISLHIALHICLHTYNCTQCMHYFALVNWAYIFSLSAHWCTVYCALKVYTVSTLSLISSLLCMLSINMLWICIVLLCCAFVICIIFNYCGCLFISTIYCPSHCILIPAHQPAHLTVN